MKNFAAVDQSGELVFTVSPASDSDYHDGMTTPDGLVMREFPIELSHDELMAKYYWSDDIGWKARAERPAGYYSWDATSEQWQVDLSVLKTKKSKELNALCRDFIRAGFISDALGAPHTYPFKETDQQNLNGSVVASLLESDPTWTTPFWSMSQGGAWDFRQHNAAQIQQVGREGKQFLIASLERHKLLQERLTAAATAEEAESVVW